VERITPRQKREEELAAQAALPKICTIDEPLDIRDLAEKLRMKDTEVIKHLFMKGMMVTVNQTLDIDFAKSVAKELGFEVIETEEVKHEGEYKHLNQEPAKVLDEAQSRNMKERSPVVSIMGHVDHGKTTLLDSIRETRHKVVDSEAGGITQSIGAYTVEKGEQTIVFLDTPGHEAFTAMRMRGAQATDIAILVVSADDGVMPQTIEAINHAKVAKIPIIVAVNKIDKADADPDRVLVQLAEYGLSAEKWGGDTLTVEVSALQKLGLDELLDAILLVSELLELKADATIPAEGVIIEAQLDKRTGPIATVLVKTGTLRVGDNVLIGATGGRVRALIDDHGGRIQEAGPSTPVEILGLDGVPNAGESFRVIRNDKLFKQELSDEKRKDRDQRIGVSRAVSAGFSGKSEIESDNAVKENQFNLLVKADTQGSLEAVVEVLQRMTSDEVKINIVHSATGDISEADVMLASTAKALVICFNTKADGNALKLAEQEGLNIKRYDVIYHITDDIEKWVLGQLAPETEEIQVGTAEVRQIFKVGKTGIIAGCMVTSGKLLRNAKANVMRAGKEVFSGPLNNLKRFKDDVKEVASGYECGISFDRFHDLQEGDIVEVYTVKSMERTSL
jgi:translation initiation factor IF-2